MTDAAKIDTQAPERLRAFAHETKTTLNGVSDQIADDIIALLDLSAAREAAAWQAGISALLDRVGDLPISEIAADEVIYAAKQLTPPTDTTALDRLIAERVREAVEAALAAVYEADSLELAQHGTTKIAERIEAQVAARGSKEGRDATDR